MKEEKGGGASFGGVKDYLYPTEIKNCTRLVKRGL